VFASWLQTGNTDVMRAALEASHRGWGISCVIGVAAAGGGDIVDVAMGFTHGVVGIIRIASVAGVVAMCDDRA